jgi:hypothetical protein
MNVTIAGWTGIEGGADGPSSGEFSRRLWAKLDADHPDLRERLDNDDPDARRLLAEVGLDYLHGFFIARAHRAAAPLADEYAKVSAEALRAVQQASTEYADLTKNTTTNWLAAHHRFVLTTQRARDLLERRTEIAQDLHQHEPFLGDTDPARMVYARHVPAEHRITMPNLDELRLQLANFTETSTERFAATRATITGGYPAGFEPAPIEHEPFERPAGEEIAWTPEQFRAAPAVVAGERNW